MAKMQAYAALLAITGLTASASLASETRLYTYDALGRLTIACRARPGDSERTNYSFDAADNRQSYANTATIMVLPADSSLFSLNHSYYLRMQGDGNLVLFGPTTSLWASNTAGSGAIAAKQQPDGNLVLYNSSNAIVWSSGTGMGNSCALLSVRDDGNAVISNDAGATIWSKGTSGN